MVLKSVKMKGISKVIQIMWHHLWTAPEYFQGTHSILPTLQYKLATIKLFLNAWLQFVRKKIFICKRLCYSSQDGMNAVSSVHKYLCSISDLHSKKKTAKTTLSMWNWNYVHHKTKKYNTLIFNNKFRASASKTHSKTT